MTPILNRRQVLGSMACGFGSLALTGLSNDLDRPNPLAPAKPHFVPKAKRVIFLFMRGGPSQVDTFDYKPLLQKHHGRQSPYIPKLQKAIGRQLGSLLKSPFEWKQHGESGHWVSELFPNIARHADKLCMVKSMHTDGFDHGQAILKLNTGANNFIRPSIGSWAVYGLGTENQNLPGFISISPPEGVIGTRGFSNVFLPAICQGTPIGRAGTPIANASIADIQNKNLEKSLQRKQLDLIQQRNRRHLLASAKDLKLEGQIESYELAFRMQMEAPSLMDISNESSETLKMYGVGEHMTDDFGRQCLMARRFAEAGVRFIQVTHSERSKDIPNWDQHSNLVGGLRKNAAQVDQPIAALLHDLESRGMLEDTLIWWGGEFGRTPVFEVRNNDKGRDHNPTGFTHWLAGAGVKPGFSFGSTDDYGYKAVENRVHMHDMHATILHLLGLDHERLTYRYAGRDFRLTDVYGNVVKDILT